MEFGLVDEDDPLAFVVQDEGREEQEKLELAGTQQIDLQPRSIVPAEDKEEIEGNLATPVRIGKLDSEPGVGNHGQFGPTPS